MKITNKMISIPPYLSTSWSNVAAIYMKGNVLVVNLIDGDTITVPGLSAEILEEIFLQHSSFLESLSQSESLEGHSNTIQEKIEHLIEFPFRFGIGSTDGLAMNLMQHNSAQKQAPDMPREFLDKIASIAKAVIGEDALLFLKPEPHCNCPHCQMARTIQSQEQSDAKLQSDSSREHQDNFDEEVKDEELQFQQWGVVQTGDQLFSVFNRLDEKEKYSVFLGKPIGCTCGQGNCEHIEAVLKAPLL